MTNNDIVDEINLRKIEALREQLGELQQKINELTQQGAHSFIETTNKITKLEAEVEHYKRLGKALDDQVEYQINHNRELERQLDDMKRNHRQIDPQQYTKTWR